MPFTRTARRSRRSVGATDSRASRWTAALIGGPTLLIALAGCGATGQPETLSGAAAPAGFSTSPSESPVATSSSPATAPRWAGTTQALQIKGSRITDGVTYLQVRPTAKNSGAWTDVVVSAEAQNDPKRGKSGDARQLLAALAERTTSEQTKGFSVTFDQQGQVTKTSWLYLTAHEAADANIDRWAGTTQFLQIQSAREKDGITYLKVRPAKKEYLGESFETVTIGGPWTEVVMSALAENVPLKGVGGDADQLRRQLSQRTTSDREEGFDISFVDQGEVRKVTWLYVL